MTRTDIITVLDHFDATSETHWAVLDRAIDELRKNCAGCRFFDGYEVQGQRVAFCNAVNGELPLPVDGSGYCHRFDAKP